MSDDSRAAFAAFQRLVWSDPDLMAELEAPADADADAYGERVVAAAARRGFQLEAEDVMAARRAGMTMFLTHWTPGQ
jgi:hypothetical protein